MTSDIQERIAKARMYGNGELAIKFTPPVVARVGKHAICDYCDHDRPVCIEGKTKEFLVCWICVCHLVSIHGDNWEEIVEKTLRYNHAKRLQFAAAKKVTIKTKKAVVASILQ